MESCPYCGQWLDDSEPPPDSLDDDGQLLWCHPLMQCPELGEMVFTFPGKAPVEE